MNTCSLLTNIKINNFLHIFEDFNKIQSELL